MLIGEGQAKVNGQVVSGAEAMRSVGSAPFVLGPKEGLALLNGTQVSTALALAGPVRGREPAGRRPGGRLPVARSHQGLGQTVRRTHPRGTGSAGPDRVAAAVRGLLDGSEIDPSHPNCGRVQDPYSIRCVPQVMGAASTTCSTQHARLGIEANAASDNPLVFTDTGEVMSGGNFHAEPVAFAADIIALAVAEIGAISERRMALLLDTGLSGLPAFLIRDSGVNSGFMIAQVTAAALAAENQCLANPSSVTSLPTSANQEDHVSMATYGARRLADMVNNAAVVVGIEAMAAAQGMEFDRSLKTSPLIEAQFAAIRQRVAYLEQDRYLAPDIDAMREWAQQSNWPAALHACQPSYADRLFHCIPTSPQEPTMNANDAIIAASASANTDPRHDASRVIRAPRGSQLTCKSWLTEAAYRMIQNNLDPEVAERPQDLVVYGGIGRALRAIGNVLTRSLPRSRT